MRLWNLAAGLMLAGVFGSAAADLYRWKDPATGMVKIYSYPPPWYGNPQLERRSPKVEHIPERLRVPVVQPVSAPPALSPLTAQPGAPGGQPPPPLVKRPLAELPR